MLSEPGAGMVGHGSFPSVGAGLEPADRSGRLAACRDRNDVV